MAIERAYVWVVGPAGSGKTTLVEQVLKSNRSPLLMAARWREDPSVRRPTEVSQRGPETERYRSVGASNTVIYRYPPDRPEDAEEDFWDTEFMTDFSHFLFEAETPAMKGGDLAVFVTRPLPARRALLVKRRIRRARALEEALSSFRGTPIYDRLRREIGREVRKHVAGGVRFREERWTLLPSHAALLTARLVVINIRNERERGAAERLAGEVARIRADAAVRRHVLGGRHDPGPATIVMANLADPRDPGLRKALARIKAAVIRASATGDATLE